MTPMSVPRPRPERALTSAQRDALLAMRSNGETSPAELAEALGMRPNGAALALRGLERRGLAARDEESWTITFAGRGLARRLAEAKS